MGLKKVRPGCPISGPREVNSNRVVPMTPEHVFARMEIGCSVMRHVVDSLLLDRFCVTSIMHGTEQCSRRNFTNQAGGTQYSTAGQFSQTPGIWIWRAAWKDLMPPNGPICLLVHMVPIWQWTKVNLRHSPAVWPSELAGGRVEYAIFKLQPVVA
jgi:hypothetical protein